MHTGEQLVVPSGEDLETLLALGRRLDHRLAGGGTVRQAYIAGRMKIRDKRGRLRGLAANRAQREFEGRAGERNIVLKARQVGISTWIAARFFMATITRPGTVSVQVAHDQDSAEAIFRIVHRFLANLPEAMREGPLRTSRANVRQICFPELDSEYRVESAADLNAGRGLTIHNLHCSEVARWPGGGEEALASLRAAVAPGGAIVLESTPSGAAGCFFEEWQRAAHAGYVRHFFPWWFEASYARRALGMKDFTREECALMEREGLTAEQIAFRREIGAQFGRLAPQEYAEDDESCFLASSECVFDLAKVQERVEQCCEAVESRDNGRWLEWFPPAAGKRYIVGVDPAGGGANGDYSCAQVIERESGMQCAELLGHLPPCDLARAVVRLARQYGDALVAVERNNQGAAVIEHLTFVEPYDHLYAPNGVLGWQTNVASRVRMLAHFQAIFEAEPWLLNSPRLLNECRTFVRREDGSPGAAAGAHDDCIMAMAIALAVRQEMPRGTK